MDGIRRMVLAMHPLRFENKIIEGQRKQGFNFLASPVMSNDGRGGTRINVHIH